jgi:hypothetical protein
MYMYLSGKYSGPSLDYSIFEAHIKLSKINGLI